MTRKMEMKALTKSKRVQMQPIEIVREGTRDRQKWTQTTAKTIKRTKKQETACETRVLLRCA
jgi:translation initiation factor 2 beta subunit (eIF-2beta)/eIF-5